MGCGGSGGGGPVGSGAFEVFVAVAVAAAGCAAGVELGFQPWGRIFMWFQPDFWWISAGGVLSGAGSGNFCGHMRA